MRTTTLAGLALAALAGLTGCSGSSTPAIPTAPPTTTAASPSPTKVASTGDYADAISEYARDIRSHAAAEMDDCAAVKQCASTAIFTRAFVGLAQERLRLVEPRYGAAPREIVTLVTDTEVAISTAIAELDGVQHEEDDPTGAIAAMDALAALLDRWAPYGV